jgi:hypothetical protein
MSNVFLLQRSIKAITFVLFGNGGVIINLRPRAAPEAEAEQARELGLERR